MTTLSTMRTELRTELRDTDATAYRWTDDELARHLRRAVVEYSKASPREMKTAIATTAASRDITISGITGYDELVRVLAVEFPINQFPMQRQRFAYFNGVVTVLGDVVPDGSNANIYWGANHALADAGSPTCSIPERDHEIVMGGAAAHAALAWANYAINRVNTGGDRTPKQWFDWGNWKLKTFQDELRRLRSKVRTSTLYQPSPSSFQSQTTDRGP